jgi:host factor-I protein
MESKPAQNIQDTFLNTVRKDKSPITIYLVSGVKLTGKIRSFDKYSVLLENNSQEQLIFKHAISTVVSGRAGAHVELRSDARSDNRMEGRPEPRAHAGNSAIHHSPAEIAAAAGE